MKFMFTVPDEIVVMNITFQAAIDIDIGKMHDSIQKLIVAEFKEEDQKNLI